MAKVRVTRMFGACDPVGYMDAKLNMETNLGKIVGIGSGTMQSGVCFLGSGAYNQALGWRSEYVHNLQVQYSHATGAWAFPTGNGSVYNSRTGVWPNGVSRVAPTGGVILSGGTTFISITK